MRRLVHALRRAIAATLTCFLAALATTATALTFTVTNTSDIGLGTLRQAITDSNLTGGTNVIVFNIPGAGVHTIALTATELPRITRPVTINGYSQPGSSPNSNPMSAGINAVLLIELNGIYGRLYVEPGAAGTVIRGLVINGGCDCITVRTDNVTIAGNFLGTNATGTVGLLTPGGGFGIRHNGGNNLTIGGPNPVDRNLISGNSQGSVILDIGSQPPVATGHLIEGNYVGTDVTGMLSLQPFSFTVGLDNINNAVVRGNLVSGNPGGGIVTRHAFGQTGPVTIQGNLVGPQRNGVSPLANGNFGGIYLTTNDVLIGGSGALANVIAFNYGVGITSLPNTQGNRFTENSIHSNVGFGGLGFGIQLTQDLATLANDLGDPDTVPGNDGQNYPVTTSASIAAGNATVSGTLNSLPSKQFRIEYFANPACGTPTFGQGQTFIGATNVTTNASGNASFGPLVFPVPSGQAAISSTATDVLLGNTSEFSACVVATQAKVCELDVNGDTSVSADKDAVILLRYMLGMRGAALIAGVPLGPLRADVTAVETLIGTSAQYDVFGQPSAPAVAMQDGLVLLRLMLSVPDTALLNAIALPAGATFTTGSMVRGNVNARCGTSY